MTIAGDLDTAPPEIVYKWTDDIYRLIIILLDIKSLLHLSSDSQDEPVRCPLTILNNEQLLSHSYSKIFLASLPTTGEVLTNYSPEQAVLHSRTYILSCWDLRERADLQPLIWLSTFSASARKRSQVSSVMGRRPEPASPPSKSRGWRLISWGRGTSPPGRGRSLLGS